LVELCVYANADIMSKTPAMHTVLFASSACSAHAKKTAMLLTNRAEWCDIRKRVICLLRAHCNAEWQYNIAKRNDG
jgi:hypothetical protein